jgi:hypothetical protein
MSVSGGQARLSWYLLSRNDQNPAAHLLAQIAQIVE